MTPPPLPAARAPVIRVGCAGWGVQPQHAALFPPGGSHLERYARLFDTVEINSSFYRQHQHKTYVCWADAVPEGFRFWVKTPREITHQRRLLNCEDSLMRFLEEISGLGRKLDMPSALTFFTLLRQHYPGAATCEPRHASWFSMQGEKLLQDLRLARVAADPAKFPTAGASGGDTGFSYYRLHGSPEIYYSPYPEAYLRQLAHTLQSASGPAWYIFDNTARGAATVNALDTMNLLGITTHQG